MSDTASPPPGPGGAPARDASGGLLAQRLSDIEARRLVVAVLGLGYIGLPVAQAFVEAGFRVLGYDADRARVERIAGGGTPLRHLGQDFVARLAATGRFSATDDAARLREADAFLLCVPTPLGADDQPDLDEVRAAGRAVAGALRPGALVALESTTYPGTTREELLPLLAASGLRCGHDLFVAHAPERVDPGRATPASGRIPRVVGGLDAASGTALAALYAAAFERVVAVRSAEVAESAKLLENIYRAVNIAMVNEMKMLLTALDIDVQEVLDAAETKPFGFTAFRPGPGWGGHCIPIDPFYLAWRARQAGQPARFIELAGQVNRAMPEWVVARARAALAARRAAGGGRAAARDPLAGARVLVLGLAYKPDIDDTRESPSWPLIALLHAAGAQVAYHDPHVPALPRRRPPDLPELASVPLDAASLARHDLVVIATDHSCFDYALLAASAALVVDTRGALRRRGLSGDNVVPA